MKKEYLLFLFMMILAPLFIEEAECAVVYSDINPDTTLHGTTENQISEYDLDLNNDGNIDFYFKHLNIDGESYAIEAYCMIGTNNEILINSQNQPIAFESTEPIAQQNETWYNTATDIGSAALFMNESWAGKDGYFLGVRIQVNGEWLYGWVRMSVPEDQHSLIILDYAYEDQSGVPILTGSGIPSDVTDDTNGSENSIYYTDGKLLIWQTHHLYNHSTICIFDMMGNEVYSNSVSNNSAVDVNFLQKGCYLCVLNYAGKIITGKFIK